MAVRAKDCYMSSPLLYVFAWLWAVWCAIKLYYIGVWSLWKQLTERHIDPSADLPADLTSRVVIVTGGATGIGKEVTTALASRKATVVIASKDIDAMVQTVACVKQKNPEAKVDFMVLNLASFKSIQSFVKKFTSSYSQLHILINNAGVMLTPYGLTEEGFEHHFGVNYLGHMLLTFLLLDKLQKSGTPGACARIINITSSTHLVADTCIHTWFHSQPHSFSSHVAYANSKLAILLSTYQLEEILRADNCSHVTVNAVHPGVVNTALYDNLHWSVNRIMKFLAVLLFKSPSQGAATVLYGALSKDLEGHGGLYLDNCSPTQSSAASYSHVLQQQLWDQTRTCIRKACETSTYLLKQVLQG